MRTVGNFILPQFTELPKTIFLNLFFDNYIHIFNPNVTDRTRIFNHTARCCGPNRRYFNLHDYSCSLYATPFIPLPSGLGKTARTCLGLHPPFFGPLASSCEPSTPAFNLIGQCVWIVSLKTPLRSNLLCVWFLLSLYVLLLVWPHDIYLM